MSCSEWKEYRLEEVIEEFIDYRGRTPKKVNSGIPLITAKIVKSGRINTPNEFIREEDYESWMTRGIPKKGDVILTTEAPLGEVAQITSNEKIALAQRIITLRSNSSLLDNTFLKYLLQSPIMQWRLSERASGTTVVGIKSSELRKVNVNIPSLEKQKKIVNILSSLDDKIELNNEMNKTLDEMAQSIFKRWFVDFEFPNEDGEPYKSSGGEMVESELGMIPKGWEYGLINDTCEKIYSGGTPKTSEETYWNGELNWMSSGETRNNFIIDTEKYITQQGADKSSTKLANRLNTVIASAGQGFTRGQTSLLLIDTYINQSLITLKPKYYYEFFNYFNIKRRYGELRNISDSHSIRGSLTTKMICKLGTILPNIEVLKEFCVIIEPIIIQIENNIRNSQNIAELRNLLLPKLMNGEIKF